MTRGSTLDRVIRLSGLPVLIANAPATRPYKHVLAAIGFSLPSRRAAALAATLNSGADMRYVHVYNQSLAGMFGAESETDRVKRIEEMLVNEVPAASARANVVVKTGEVIGALFDEARSWPADLLVLGTHGRTGVGLAMLGSVAEQFVASPPCDVLIAKAW